MWLILDLNPKKRGSQERQLSSLARTLRRRGVAVTYVFSAPPAPWLREELAALDVTLRTLDFSSPLRSAARLLPALAAARPSLVHLHFVRSSSPLLLAARLCGARVLLNDHMALVRPSDSLAREYLKRARDAVAAPLVDARLSVSPFVAETVARVEHVERRKIRVIENGIDVERYASADPTGIAEALGAAGRPLLLCVSRLHSDKGVDTAIRALALLDGHDDQDGGARELAPGFVIRERAAPQLRLEPPVASPTAPILALAGEGPMEAPWRALASSLGVADRVRFLGLRDDVDRLLAAADVVIAPTQNEEAFGQSVVEGMAAGKPLVVTRSGAMPGIVGDTGVVVRRRDPQAMAAAVRRLLADAPLRARLGRAAQARARAHYDLSSWVQRTVALYEDLCPMLQCNIPDGGGAAVT